MSTKNELKCTDMQIQYCTVSMVALFCGALYGTFSLNRSRAQHLVGHWNERYELPDLELHTLSAVEMNWVSVAAVQYICKR